MMGAIDKIYFVNVRVKLRRNKDGFKLNKVKGFSDALAKS